MSRALLINAGVLSSLLITAPNAGAQFHTIINIPPDSDPGWIGSNTKLNLTDPGWLGHSFQAGYPNGASTNVEVNISGGNVGWNFAANGGSEVNISGGTVGNQFDALPGSEVNISGGTVGWGFKARSGSDVELIGGKFQLNGSAFSGSSVTLSSNDVFTGTLADGSVFIFSDQADSLNGVSLTHVSLPTLDTTPIVVDGSNPQGPNGLRAGQTLTLRDGGELGRNFAAVNARLNIEGGTVGHALETAGSMVNIYGGSVGDASTAVSGSVVNISGGNVGDFFAAAPGSVVNIFGGTVGDGFVAVSGSEVNISGASFMLDAQSLGLLPGETRTIDSRGGSTLSGQLLDGQPFEFTLNDGSQISDDFFSPDALLTIAVPLPGDLNLDGVVDGLDIDPFVKVLTGDGPFNATADIDGNGIIDGLDIDPFVQLLTDAGVDNASRLIPEPTSLALLGLGGLALLRRRGIKAL